MSDENQGQRFDVLNQGYLNDYINDIDYPSNTR